MDIPLLFSFVAYLVLILVIGASAYTRTHDIDDYILGGRRLGAVVTALSVGASDMSGWLLLGLPGAIYLAGLSEVWIGIGLVCGAYTSWRLISRRLRVYSHHARNSLTLPDYLENRFADQSRVLRVLSAAVILLFFTFYTASGLVGGAILFESSFGLDYRIALYLGALVIVSYTFVGGFLAVSWTDALQAGLMLLALIITPLVVVQQAGGIGALVGQLQEVSATSTSLLYGTSLAGIVSLLAWGLGYFGQPHILARFMAIESPARLVSARRIAMSWMIVVLLGSATTGLAGMAYFAEQPLDNPETVFIELSRTLFNPWIAGIISAAILSAIMSTIDSQLLVSSSVIGEDFYRVFVRPDADKKELLLVSRAAVIAIALLAVVIASDRNSRVLDLVSYAWAGFGAAFGPVILFSLFWRRMTGGAAISGMICGAVTVLLWSNLQGGWFDLYEILPGFVLASMSIVIVTLTAPQRNVAVLAEFDEVQVLGSERGSRWQP
ncbi:MAG: sodium/proline symporter PutP [Gammaproteobacteria bacterium]|nr:sodium/proline symporter PutP [Pseudomonadales bacterium]MCP5346458.1 sodium/proline symporter PutP [Pseudomonadales bacterium]